MQVAGSSMSRLGGIVWEQSFDLKLSGNEVYYKAGSVLVIVKYSCSKPYCQKVLD
jgi:hypothetical protein